MPVIIQKFGGKLLETPDLIRRAAQFIIAKKKSGFDPVVVVSAPGNTTDTFFRLAKEITDNPDEREMDMMLSVGERMAMALLAMAINTEGSYRAVSFTGSQVGIITDTRHTDARIIEVKCLRIRETLERGEIPIVAGFQGVSTEREITTLGRGGSDSTAIALSAALGAVRCELVKESGAIHSGDPVLLADAVPYSEIDFETLEAITTAGATVVQSGAVSLAKRYDVKLQITGTDGNNGTLITDKSQSRFPVAAVTIQPDLLLMKEDDIHLERMDSDCIKFVFLNGNSRYVVISDEPNPNDYVRVALVTVVGWNRAVSGSLINEILQILKQEAIETIAWFSVNGCSTFIVRNQIGVRALEALHRYCLDNGLIGAT